MREEEKVKKEREAMTFEKENEICKGSKVSYKQGYGEQSHNIMKTPVKSSAAQANLALSEDNTMRLSSQIPKKEQINPEKNTIETESPMHPIMKPSEVIMEEEDEQLPTGKSLITKYLNFRANIDP